MSQSSEISLIPSPTHPWTDLLDAMTNQKYRTAFELLEEILDGTLLPDDEIRRELCKRALVSGDLILYRFVCKIIGGKYLFDPVYFEEAVKTDAHNLLGLLAQTYPDAMSLVVNPSTERSPPTHIAIQANSIKTFEIIFPFATKETILRYSSDQISLLTEATLCGSDCVVELLTDLSYISDLIQVANTDPVQSFSVLHYAALTCRYPTFKKLFDAFSAIGNTRNLPTQDCLTVLMIMICCDAPKARLFIDYLINDLDPNHPLLTEPDAFGSTPLHSAAIMGSGEIVNALYTTYATKDLLLTRDAVHDFTFFDCLVHLNHASIIKELLVRDDFDRRLLSIPEDPSSTPIDHAILMEYSEIAELMYPLSVETGVVAELCSQDINVLQRAAYFDLKSLVQLITSDPNMCSTLMIGDDDDSHTPLHVAAYMSSAEVYALIYEYSTVEQVRLQEKHWGLTALHLCVLYRDQGMIELVLRDQAKARAMMEVRDVDGLTALDYARMRSLELATILEAAMSA